MPFGAYRWRADGRLLLIPFTTDGAPTLFEVDASAGRAVQLTDPALTSLPIANGEWFVSPDGSLVAFTSWVDRAIWVLTLPD
jgi:Tol biopolymer transport system component